MKRRSFMSLLAMLAFWRSEKLVAKEEQKEAKVKAKKKESKTMMPALFIGHGSPMNAIEDNEFTRKLTELGKELPRPKAVLCISAHWQSKGTWVTGMANPKTIHDFYGFPQPLFDVQYPAPGDPELAKKIADKVNGVHIDDSEWGLDHGTWSVLKFLFPKADVPIIQLSLDVNKSDKEHFELGEKIRELREEGVMIVGSGNIVHNLRAIQWKNPNGGLPWANTFDQWVKEELDKRNYSKESPLVTSYLNRDDGRMSVPSTEHYLPLLYVMGSAREEDKLTYDYEGMNYGSLSMRTLRFS